VGTSIELKIGSVSLAFGKNDMGQDFGHLFQDIDLCRRNSEAIDYSYYEGHQEELDDLDLAEEMFARPLSRVLPRLAILGSTLEAARVEYEKVVADAKEFETHRNDSGPIINFLSFDEFCNLACCVPLRELKDEYIECDTLALGRFALQIADFNRLPWTENSDSYWSEASYLSSRICILSAESMLQVFALNPANEDVEVTWEFGPLVDAGWVQRSDFVAGARRQEKVLVVTEGASDARIINRSLEVLRPDVKDFFHFVDVDERHHFWGAGNLIKFAEGLLRIDILNKVLFVFDNDAEGVDAFRKLEKLNLPVNMRAMVLPDLDEFKEFTARGPEGVSTSNINGRAAAIECYLDLRLIDYPNPQVLWSNYKRDIDSWHGALEFKETYSKHFFNLSNEQLKDGHYDISRLTKLLDSLVQEAELVRT
jgi:HEPN/Toprim N-terminal domain 1